MIYAAIPFLLLGLLMYARGWIYTVSPDGPMALKRKKRNLKLGFTTDMKVFGRKVRRTGFLVLMVGGGLVAWDLSGRASADAPAELPVTTGETR
jgi:hypothetical protein